MVRCEQKYFEQVPEFWVRESGRKTNIYGPVRSVLPTCDRAGPGPWLKHGLPGPGQSARADGRIHGQSPDVVSDQQSRGRSRLAAAHFAAVSPLRRVRSPVSSPGAGVLPPGGFAVPQKPAPVRVLPVVLQRTVRLLAGAPFPEPGGSGGFRSARPASGACSAGHGLVRVRWWLGRGGGWVGVCGAESPGPGGGSSFNRG